MDFRTTVSLQLIYNKIYKIILLSNYTLNYYFKNKKKFKYKIIFRIFGMIILKYNEINNYKNKIKTIEIH